MLLSYLVLISILAKTLETCDVENKSPKNKAQAVKGNDKCHDRFIVK